MVLAMANQMLEQRAEARSSLANGMNLAKTKLPPPDGSDLGRDWGDFLLAQALIREATALIKGGMKVMKTSGVISQ